MATKTYLSLERLAQYNELIKAKIAADDATTLAAAKSYADTQVSTLANGAVAEAKSAADAAQGAVDTLGDYVGTFTASEGVDTVVKYIDAKTTNIASNEKVNGIDNRVTVVEGDVATIKANYLDGDDKTELEGKINAKADQSALDTVSGVANAAVAKTDYDVKVKALEDEDTRIVGLVNAEAERAAGVEAGLESRLEGVEAFFKLAEGESLDTALDTLKEIQTYITTEGAAADQMVLDIAANAQAIEDMDTAYKAADETLQGNIDTLTGVVNGKVAQDDFDTLSGKVATAEGKISDNETAISTLQGKVTLGTYMSGEEAIEYDTVRDYVEAVIEEQNSAIRSYVNTEISYVNDNAYETFAEKATTLAGYNISDAYTSAQTDAAIANAMSQFTECTEADINGLFTTSAN